MCGYVYDSAKGDPEGKIPPGTSFPQIPPDWTCPQCEAKKGQFIIAVKETTGP